MLTRTRFIQREICFIVALLSPGIWSSYTQDPLSSWIVLNHSEGATCEVSANCVDSPHYPNNYSSLERCVLAVRETATVHIDPFDTESVWDTLTIGPRTFYGHWTSATSITVSPSTSIVWTSFGEDKGWKMCTQPYTPPAPSSWTVLSEWGHGCHISGPCVTSPQYPNSYDSFGRCGLAVKENSTVLIDSFDTRLSDWLTLGSLQLHGHLDTHAYAEVLPNSSIVWRSGNTTDSINHTPPSTWRVLSEDGYGCDVSANCVTSPHYSSNYGFPGSCVLAVQENRQCARSSQHQCISEHQRRLDVKWAWAEEGVEDVHGSIHSSSAIRLDASCDRRCCFCGDARRLSCHLVWLTGVLPARRRECWIC